MRLTGVILAAALYAGNWLLCNWGCGDNLICWYNAKHALLSLVIFILAIQSQKQKLTGVVLSLIAAWALNDIIDRMVFDIRYFRWNDLLTTALTLTLLQWKIIKSLWIKIKS